MCDHWPSSKDSFSVANIPCGTYMASAHMVIDPSLFDHLVTESEWVAAQVQQNPAQGLKVLIRNRFVYYRDQEPGQWIGRYIVESREILKEYSQQLNDGKSRSHS